MFTIAAGYACWHRYRYGPVQQKHCKVRTKSLECSYNIISQSKSIGITYQLQNRQIHIIYLDPHSRQPVLEATRCHKDQDSKQLPGISKEKSDNLPPGHKGPVLQDTC